MNIIQGIKAFSCLLLASCQMCEPAKKSEGIANSEASCAQNCDNSASQNKVWMAKDFKAPETVAFQRRNKGTGTSSPGKTSSTCPSQSIQCSTSDDEQVWQRIKNSGKLVVGVKADAPPFSLQTSPGEFAGFEIDLAKAVAKNMGITLEIVPVSAKDRSPFILQDKVDVIMATMTLSKNRDEIIDFSVPYFEVGQGLIVKSNSDIHSFRDLQNLPVAVLEGTQAFHTLSRIQSDSRLVIVQSYEQGIQMILRDEVVALCSDHVLLTGLLYEHEDKMKLKLLQQTFDPNTYGIALKENESQLRDALNRALMKIWEDGTWQDIYETWFEQGSMYGHETRFRIDLIPE